MAPVCFSFFLALSFSALHSDFVAVVCVCSEKAANEGECLEVLLHLAFLLACCDTLTAHSEIRLWFALSSQNSKHHLLSLVSNVHDMAGPLSLSASSL